MPGVGATIIDLQNLSLLQNAGINLEFQDLVITGYNRLSAAALQLGLNGPATVSFTNVEFV